MIRGLLLISILFLTIISCKKHKDCPAFKDADLIHIAYSVGDTLTFINQQSDTMNIYIKNLIKSADFEQDCREIENVCPCINYLNVLAKNSNSSTEYNLIRMEQSDASEMRYFYYHVFDYNFEIDFDNELQYVNDFPYLDVVSSITIGNKQYYNVIIYSNLENNNSIVSKVYLTKSDGILKILQKDNKSWEKIK